MEPESDKAAETLCQVAFAAAAAHQLIVFDPQLGREVVAGDSEQIAQRLQQSRSFAESFPLTQPAAPGLSLTAGGRLWLIIGGGFVGLLLFARALSCLVS